MSIDGVDRLAKVQHGLERVVEISVPRGRLPRLGGVVVHRPNDLDVAWVTRRHGIPVTTPARTVIDLGAVVGARFVEDALDRGLVTRLVTVSGVEHALEVDGFSAHSSPSALQADLERQNALVALGWTVLRFTWADVVQRPEAVASRVRHVLGTLRSA